MSIRRLAVVCLAALALSSAAVAGTIQIASSSPVGVKLDGEWVTRGGTLTTMTDVAEGKHRVQICNLVGQPITFADVDVGPDHPVQLTYADKRLDLVPPPEGEATAPAPSTSERIAIPRDAFAELQRSLVKGTPKQRKAVLAEAVRGTWFEMRHVTQLVASFEGLEDRVEVATLLAPWTLDPEHVDALDDVMPTGSHRERAKAPFVARQSAE